MHTHPVQSVNAENAMAGPKYLSRVGRINRPCKSFSDVKPILGQLFTRTENLSLGHLQSNNLYVVITAPNMGKIKKKGKTTHTNDKGLTLTRFVGTAGQAKNFITR